ncbi:hypothetical protein ACFSCX_15900 [Bacillus salitolerans]|uniref:Uncharacterized protein n=1 Tax=Bacillus salitolerans TaxID=1437434 RepID=A0ABW4LS69_9BACI
MTVWLKGRLLQFISFLLFIMINVITLKILFTVIEWVYVEKIDMWYLATLPLIGLLLLVFSYQFCKKFYFGYWRFILYIPFINVLIFFILNTYLIGLVGGHQGLEDDYAFGMILLVVIPIVWLLYVIPTVLGVRANKVSRPVKI